MAPKKKEHSNDLRKLVIQHFLNGDSQRAIASKTLLSRATVQTMIRKYKKTKCIGTLAGRGRKRLTTVHEDRTIQRKIKVNRRISARTVQAEIETELNLKVSKDTIRRRAHEIGLNGRVARKKPYVNEVNRGKRMKYAKMYRHVSLDFWNNVLWSDGANSTFLVLMAKSSCGERHGKKWTQNVRFLRSSTVVAM